MIGLFILLIAAQIADAYTTLQALKRPGVYEANPFLRKIMDAIGVKEALLLVKVASCVVVWFGVMYLEAQGHGQLATGLLVAACALYALIAYRNWKLR